MNRRNKRLEKNIAADYVFCFLRNFDIASAIWVLYMIYRGLPLWQIGIVEGIFHVTSFLLEVPSGALADLFGRKRVVIFGRILYIVSAVIQLFSTNVYTFSLAFIISAASYNMNSGSEEALLYDSMKLLGREKEYIGVNSRLNMILEVSSALATFIGGILAEYSYHLCYLAVVVIALLSMIPAFLFTEPEMEKSISKREKEKISFRTHFRTCADILKKNREVTKILLYYPVVTTFCTVVYFYGQEFFSEYGLNKIQISVIMLIMGVFSCLGAWSSEKMLKVFGGKTKYLASVGMGVAILVMSGEQLAVSVLGFVVANFACSMLYPIQSAELNAKIPSEQRATLISVDSMIFSIAMILFFPTCGFVADRMGLHLAFGGLGMIQILLMFLLLTGKRKKEMENYESKSDKN